MEHGVLKKFSFFRKTNIPICMAVNGVNTTSLLHLTFLFARRPSKEAKAKYLANGEQLTIPIAAYQCIWTFEKVGCR